VPLELPNQRSGVGLQNSPPPAGELRYAEHADRRKAFGSVSG
jgi:hypothetical protein